MSCVFDARARPGCRVRPRRRRDPSPRIIHVATAAAATRFRGISTSRLRRWRDPSPRIIHVATAAAPRPVSAEYPRRSTSRPRPRRDGPASAEYPRRGRGRRFERIRTHKNYNFSPGGRVDRRDAPLPSSSFCAARRVAWPRRLSRGGAGFGGLVPPRPSVDGFGGLPRLSAYVCGERCGRRVEPRDRWRFSRDDASNGR